MKILVVPILTISLFGCGGASDSDDSLLNTVTTIVQESDEDDYKKSEYRFYGLFYGSSGEENSLTISTFIVDNSTQKFTSIVAGSNFVYRQGTFNKDNLDFVSSTNTYNIDNEITLYDSSENDIGERFHFNYTEQSQYVWSISGTDRNSFLEFEGRNSTDASIPRDMIFPAKLSFFGSDFISQESINNTDLITSITIDEDGDISGSDTEGCLFSGSISRGNKHVNSYPVSMTIDNCSNTLNNGNFTGLLSKSGFAGEQNTLTDRIEGDATNIILMVHNENRAMYIKLAEN